MKSFWQYVTFTNEAHVDSNQMHRDCIFKKENIQLHSNNLQKMSDTQKVKLHMTDFVSWHVKGSLIFYNNEHDSSLVQVKKNFKSRRSKYLIESNYQKLLREWKFRQFHDVNVKSKENFMINKYYTKKLPSELLKVINEHKAVERRTILQKNNDFSHVRKLVLFDCVKRLNLYVN